MKWNCLFLLACMACARSNMVSTTVDGVSWSGPGQATEVHVKANRTCAVDRFNLNAFTYVPSDKMSGSANLSSRQPGDTVRQYLSFSFIPLEIGTYNLAILDTCLHRDKSTREKVDKVNNASFYIVDTNTETRNIIGYYQFGNSDTGWVKVTKLNRNTGKIKGQFEASMTGEKGEQIHFKKGRFKGDLDVVRND